jgi:hypothetical protein
MTAGELNFRRFPHVIAKPAVKILTAYFLAVRGGAEGEIPL